LDYTATENGMCSMNRVCSIEEFVKSILYKLCTWESSKKIKIFTGALLQPQGFQFLEKAWEWWERVKKRIVYHATKVEISHRICSCHKTLTEPLYYKGWNIEHVRTTGQNPSVYYCTLRDKTYTCKR